MKPLKFETEFKSIHRKYRQAETAVKNYKNEYQELVKKKGNLRNALSGYDISAKKIEQLEGEMDEVVDKIETVKTNLKEANQRLEEIKDERAEVKQKYGKEFYSFCEKRVDEIRDHLNDIRQLNNEISEAGEKAFKMANMYVPALGQGFFNKIKKPIQILEDGKRHYEV